MSRRKKKTDNFKGKFICGILCNTHGYCVHCKHKNCDTYQWKDNEPHI